MHAAAILHALCIFHVLNVTVSETIKIGVILMQNSSEPFDVRRIGPAIAIAIDDAKTKYNIVFDADYRNYTGLVCMIEKPVGILSELHYLHNVSAVVGPACSDALKTTARLAAYLGVPIVSGLGDFVNKIPVIDELASLTILSYNLWKLSTSLSTILSYYDWFHTAILYDESYVFFELAGSNLVQDFKSVSSIMEQPKSLPFTPALVTDDYASLLTTAQAHARVIVIFCDSDRLRVILNRAYQLGMANGEYVFVTMELFPSDWLGHYMEFIRGDGLDDAVTKAYESLLLLTLHHPDSENYTTFAAEVKTRAASEFGYTFPADEIVNYFSAAFYDSVIYLAKAFRTHIDGGGSVDDGMAVAQKLWNDTFEGISGTVKVDEFGNRVADFDVFDMNSSSPITFQLAGRFRGATQAYVPSNSSIVWPNGQPIDKPACGFIGELCIEEEDDNTTTIIVAVVMVSLAVITLIASFIGYRRYKAEQELGKKTWLVAQSEIMVKKTRGNSLGASYLTLASDKTNDSTDHHQMFTQTGSYRDQTVAMRQLHIQSVDVNRDLAMEFRDMQMMNHGNLAKFVGACFDPGFMYLLMEYCPRGSLQDMLENDSIELDWDFRYSLICDIIKGMCYLHSSPIKVHGKLSSTNCVIDSRFALKLTDYGPHSVLSKDRELDKLQIEQGEGQYNYTKLLWTAPEHLREARSFSSYSQKGDVYSFGIILQEISMRAGPYEGCNIEVPELIQRLKACCANAFRPDVPADACSPEIADMMRRCWAEDPHDRPTYAELDSQFKKMRHGKTTNVIDNLLQRMSNYADNLEALAAERTKAFLVEKQKVEELLHRLLPPAVAKQLETGQPVKPETYQSVTIYFSDIVGFTTLAGRSTPIQVVALLNDLYTAFDNAINQFNVYKVETIGDAYMCVSGLPERNGNLHVVEICNMSLSILHTVKDFKIRHMPDESLRVRIGLHSGPVVAGVVGLTMPRYCLFGDTVNTASRMESTSEPLKIQMSPTTKALLDNFPTFVAEERGDIEVKGKGKMKTYWLKHCLPDKDTTTGIKPKNDNAEDNSSKTESGKDGSPKHERGTDFQPMEGCCPPTSDSGTVSSPKKESNRGCPPTIDSSTDSSPKKESNGGCPPTNDSGTDSSPKKDSDGGCTPTNDSGTNNSKTNGNIIECSPKKESVIESSPKTENGKNSPQKKESGIECPTGDITPVGE